MTSRAVPARAVAIVNPRALAVFRFDNKLEFPRLPTGSSAGLAPFRICVPQSFFLLLLQMVQMVHVEIAGRFANQSRGRNSKLRHDPMQQAGRSRCCLSPLIRWTTVQLVVAA